MKKLIPWISSLNMQYLFWYLSNKRCAFALAKSSCWMSVLAPHLTNITSHIDDRAVAFVNHSIIPVLTDSTVPFRDGLHQLIDQFVISRATFSLLPQANVEFIIQKILRKHATYCENFAIDREKFIKSHADEDWSATSLSVPTSNIIGKHLTTEAQCSW